MLSTEASTNMNNNDTHEETNESTNIHITFEDQPGFEDQLGTRETVIGHDEIALSDMPANLPDIPDMLSDTDITERKSFYQRMKDKQNDQDFKQKTNVFITLMLEIYRVLMGAFLVAFVPQKCHDTICTLNENIGRTDRFSIVVITMNSATFLVFLILYYIEVKRENKLITYLEVNRFTPVDNESVGEALKKLPSKKRKCILDYDKHYRNTGYVSTVSFLVNSVLSIMNIYKHYFDSKTHTVLLTNLLFMGLKVNDVFNTVNTKTNVFYSAYLTNKVQFNDVDPDKLITNDAETGGNHVAVADDDVEDVE